MKDHLEKYLNKKDEDYFDKFFNEDESELVEVEEEDGELESDNVSMAIASSMKKVQAGASIFKKKTTNIKKLSDLINKASEEIYLELEKLIDDLEQSSVEGAHHHADTLLEMSDFTEKMIQASKSINKIKGKL